MENFNYKAGEILLCDLWYVGTDGDSFVKGVTCKVIEGSDVVLLEALTHKELLKDLDLFLSKGNFLLNCHHKDIYTPVGLENE